MKTRASKELLFLEREIWVLNGAPISICLGPVMIYIRRDGEYLLPQFHG
jgi:hypothetical protein